MNVKVNIKSSECGKTGFIAHICRNELWYGIGSEVVVVSTGFVTWFFYCRKSQDLRNAIFSKLNLDNAEFVKFLSNANLTGNDKEARKFYLKFLTISDFYVTRSNGVTLIDFVKGLKSYYNDKVPANKWFNSVKNRSKVTMNNPSFLILPNSKGILDKKFKNGI